MVKKVIAGIVIVLLTSLLCAFYFPSNARLEFYDVRDLVYSLDGPSVDLSLVLEPPIPDAFQPGQWLGWDMANFLQSAIPGRWDESQGNVVQFTNSLLIVRAGPVQQLAVITFLKGVRAKNDALKSLGRCAGSIEANFLRWSDNVRHH